MKVLHESDTFEKIEPATTVVDPVTAEAVKTNKKTKKNFDDVLKARGYMKKDVIAKNQPKPEEIKESLEDGHATFEDVFEKIRPYMDSDDVIFKDEITANFDDADKIIDCLLSNGWEEHKMAVPSDGELTFFADPKSYDELEFAQYMLDNIYSKLSVDGTDYCDEGCSSITHKDDHNTSVRDGSLNEAKKNAYEVLKNYIDTEMEPVKEGKEKVYCDKCGKMVDEPCEDCVDGEKVEKSFSIDKELYKTCEEVADHIADTVQEISKQKGGYISDDEMKKIGEVMEMFYMYARDLSAKDIDESLENDVSKDAKQLGSMLNEFITKYGEVADLNKYMSVDDFAKVEEATNILYDVARTYSSKDECLTEAKKEAKTFWDKVWAELIQDDSFDSDQEVYKLREIEPKNRKLRYREGGIDADANIRIDVKEEGDLDFAKRVADYYGLDYRIDHTNRYNKLPDYEKVTKKPWSMTIIVPEERPEKQQKDEADTITDTVLDTENVEVNTEA